MKKQTINIINISPKYTAIWKCGHYIYKELYKHNEFNVNFIDLSKQLPNNIIKRYFMLLFKRLYFNCSDKDINFYLSPLASSLITKIQAKKNIVLIHDFWPVRNGNLLKRYLFKYLYRHIPNFEFIISNSNATKEEYLSLFKSTKAIPETIYLGLDNSFLNFKIVPNTIKSKITFISIGRDEPRKNIYFIINILLKLKQQNAVFKLIRIGEFSQQIQNLINHFNLEKYIDIKNNLSEKELIALYSTSDFLLFPSLYEGFGFPVLEASACGCIPITSSFGSLPEIIPDTRLCIDLKIEEWMNKITLINSDTSKGLFINKCKKHTNNFTWDKFTKEFIKLITNN